MCMKITQCIILLWVNTCFHLSNWRNVIWSFIFASFRFSIGEVFRIRVSFKVSFMVRISFLVRQRVSIIDFVMKAVRNKCWGRSTVVVSRDWVVACRSFPLSGKQETIWRLVDEESNAKWLNSYFVKPWVKTFNSSNNEQKMMVSVCVSEAFYKQLKSLRITDFPCGLGSWVCTVSTVFNIIVMYM